MVTLFQDYKKHQLFDKMTAESTTGGFGSTDLGDNEPQGENTLPKQNDTIPSFDNVIMHLSESSDASIRALSPILVKLRKSLEDKRLSEVNYLLKRMSDSNDYNLIYNHIKDLLSIESEYKVQATEVTGDSTEQSEKLAEGITQKELQRITGIDFNGSSTYDELLRKIKAFESAIKRGKIGTILDDTEREIIIRKLTEIIESKKQLQEIGYEYLEIYFDDLAENIKKYNGKYDIGLGDNKIMSFATKEEALDFIRNLKSTAEWNLDSLIRYSLERSIYPIGNALLNTEKAIASGNLCLYKKSLDFAGLHLDPLEWGAAIGFLIAGLAVSSAIVGVHSGILESMYRRGIKDVASKLSSNMQIEDYGRGGMITPTDMSTPEGKDFMEFKQRQQIMDLLKSDLEAHYSVGTKEYIKYKKNLENLDSFKLNRTPTFFYLAYNYGKLRGFSEKFLNGAYGLFIRGARIYYPILKAKVAGEKTPLWKRVGVGNIKMDDSKKLANNIIEYLISKNDIQEGIDLFYKNNSLNRASLQSQPPKLEVDGIDINPKDSSTYKDAYDYVRKEIASRSINSDEKRKLIEKFESYVQGLKTFPKGRSLIARDLYILLNTDFGSRSEFSQNITRKVDKIKSLSGKISITTARLRNTEIHRLENFLKLIRSGEWVGSKNDFEIELKKIETIKHYNVYANLESKLGAINFSQELKNIFSNGEAGIKGHIVTLGEFYDTDKVGIKDSSVGKDFESALKFRKPFMENIMEFIDFGIKDNAVEKSAKKEISEMFDMMINGKIIVSDSNALYNEILSLFKGFLPSYKLVEELSQITEDSKDKAELTHIKKLLAQAQEGKLNMTADELQKLKGNTSTFDFVKDRLRSINLLGVDELVRKIKDTKGWSSADYNKSLGLDKTANTHVYLERLKKDYAPEIELLRIIDLLEGRSEASGKRAQILQELQKFASSLEGNKYSKGQADHILREIFSGIKYDTITLVQEKDAADFYSGKGTFTTEVEDIWRSLSPDEKIERAKSIISNPSIDESKLNILSIKNAIDSLQGAEKTNEQIRRNIAALDGFIDDLNSVKSPNRLVAIDTDFRAYINNSLNNVIRSDEPYKSKIEDFNSLYESKEDGFSSRPKLDSSSEDPLKPDSKPTPKPKETNEGITDYKGLKSYLDEIYPSILMSGDDAARREIDSEYKKITGGGDYLERILNIPNKIDYYREKFGRIEIFSLRDLRDLSVNSKLQKLGFSEIKIELAKIDANFAGVNGFTELGDRVRGLHGTDIGENIIERLKKMRIGK